jgi:hypothetical protein
MRLRATCLALVTSVGVLGPRPAQAQADQRVLAAEALFQDGQALLDAGKVHDACAKFAESQRLDAAVGTLLNLGICHEREGKTASAWTELSDAAAQAARAGQADREKFARTHIADLEKKLSRVELHFDDGSNVTDIKVDTVAIDRAAWSVALPMDPGTHALVFSAPGKRTLTQSITVPVGPATQSFHVGVLPDEPLSATTPPAGEKPGGHKGRSYSTLGWVLGGVGVVGVGVGATFGLLAMSKKSEVDKDCAGFPCNQAGLDANDAAHTDATISTVGFALGVLALGVGAYFVLTSHPDAKPTPKAGAMKIVPTLGGKGGRMGVIAVW